MTDALVSTGWLAQNLKSPDLRVVDAHLVPADRGA